MYIVIRSLSFFVPHCSTLECPNSIDNVRIDPLFKNTQSYYGRIQCLLYGNINNITKGYKGGDPLVVANKGINMAASGKNVPHVQIVLENLNDVVCCLVYSVNLCPGC